MFSGTAQRTSCGAMSTSGRPYGGPALRPVARRGAGLGLRCAASATERPPLLAKLPPRLYSDPALQEVYEVGYKAGYGAGLNVDVRVNLNALDSLDANQQQSESCKAVEDSLQRSIVKALVWRIFSTSATVGIALVFFGENMQVDQALEFGAAEFLIKIVIYFLHERMWQMITFL